MGEGRSYAALHVEAASQLLSSSNARAQRKASYPGIGLGSGSSTSYTNEYNPKIIVGSEVAGFGISMCGDGYV